MKWALLVSVVLSVGCAGDSSISVSDSAVIEPTDQYVPESTEPAHPAEEESHNTDEEEVLCEGQRISMPAVERMLAATTVHDNEDIYSTYDRIDEIAYLFEQCGDPWGLFPTTYRRITARGIAAIENGDFADPEWAKRIIIDFANRYFENLYFVLTEDEPSWAWKQYYLLADNADVAKTRALIVAMSAHLMLDLPHCLVAIDSTEENKDDFFVFGDKMIEVSDLFIADLRLFYDTDAEDLLNGFFMGQWADGVFGEDATMALSFQTIRTKAWNNRWYLQRTWTAWIANSEIYSSFWLADGVLATLDAAGIID